MTGEMTGKIVGDNGKSHTMNRTQVCLYNHVIIPSVSVSLSFKSSYSNLEMLIDMYTSESHKDLQMLRCMAPLECFMNPLIKTGLSIKNSNASKRLMGQGLKHPTLQHHCLVTDYSLQL